MYLPTSLNVNHVQQRKGIVSKCIHLLFYVTQLVGSKEITTNVMLINHPY